MVAAVYAPSAYRLPWATFRMRMTPYTSVTPSATMNASVAIDHRARIMRARSVAPGAFEAALDPGLSLRAVRRIDAVGRIVGDVHHGGHALGLVELVDADGGLGYRLVASGARHVHGRAEGIELELLERPADLFGRRLGPALRRLVRGDLEGEHGLAHVVRRVRRRDPVALLVRGAEPVAERGRPGEHAVGATVLDEDAIRQLVEETVHAPGAGCHHHLDILVEPARRHLDHEGLEVAAREGRVQHGGLLGEERGDLGAVLAAAEGGELLVDRFDVGLQRL